MIVKFVLYIYIMLTLSRCISCRTRLGKNNDLYFHKPLRIIPRYENQCYFHIITNRLRIVSDILQILSFKLTKTTIYDNFSGRIPKIYFYVNGSTG